MRGRIDWGAKHREFVTAYMLGYDRGMAMGLRLVLVP